MLKLPIDFFGIKRFDRLYFEVLAYLDVKIEQRRRELKTLPSSEQEGDIPYLDALLAQATKLDDEFGVGKHVFSGTSLVSNIQLSYCS